MTKRKTNDNVLNQVIYINREAVKGQGEDAYSFCFAGKNGNDNNRGMIGVFDGCGGIGAKQYPNYHNRTAAYIASRIVSKAALNWYEKRVMADEKGMYAPAEMLAGGLREEMDRAISIARKALDVKGEMLFGSLVRSFPTTAAIALMEKAANSSLNCRFLWAGDSRGYILQSNGLKQCTFDDLQANQDAFDNLYNDSPLSNMISGDKPYTINMRKIACTLPAIVITATDGVFGYFQSPMHFEKMLVDTLMESASFAAWEARLKAIFEMVSGDDSTIVMAVFGWKSYRDLQKDFSARRDELHSMLAGKNEEAQLRSIWREYKKVSVIEDTGRIEKL